MDFIYKLFDTSDFPERWNCGTWTGFHGWLHILSDLAVFGAYMAIPAVIMLFAVRRKDVKLPKIFWLFCGFIFACGLVHLIEASIFFVPIYRVSAVAKFMTAIVSWLSVVGLVRIMPKALLFPTMSSLNHQLAEKNQSLLATQSQLEAALNEAQRNKTLLDATIECTWSGVVISDTDTNFVLINPAGRKLMGKLADLAPNDWNDSVGLFENEEGRLFKEHELPLFRANRGEVIERMELLMRNGVDEKPIWLRANATQIVNREKQPLGAVTVFDDITDQVKSRKGLRELHLETQLKLVDSNRQLEEVLSSIPESIWRGAGTEDGVRFVYFSPGIEQIMGYEPEKLLQEFGFWKTQVHPEDRTILDPAMEDILDGKIDETEVEHRVFHSDGSIRWIRNRIRATKGETRELQGIITDITDEHDNNMALIRAERLASVGILAAGIAHEINNPLGAMMLTTDRGKAQLRKGNIPSERIEETFDEIMQQIERCSKIVSGVLKFASNETTEREVRSLNPIAFDSQNLILFKARKRGITIQVNPSQDIEPMVNLNETEIGQVIVNLLANAIDASPADAKVELSINVEQRRVVCSVLDYGEGMDAAARKLAFDPFYTSKRADGGTGLGLSMSHTIITKHGGEIWIDDSTPDDVGTIVSFWLPRARE